MTREFDAALQYLSRNRIDTKKIVTATLPAEATIEAFDLAADESRSIKVHLAFA